MEIKRYTPPFDHETVLDLWGSIFGKAEAELERPQIDGTEAAYNEDITFVAEEHGEILGTVHVTVPKIGTKLCGVGGVCTTPAARGKGVGRMLFGAVMEELDRDGVEAMVLGTGNPVAAKLYHGFGFAFRPGSNVMMRYAKGDTVDFERELFAPPAAVRVVEGNPSMRIPLVPLVLHRSRFVVLDCNTALVNSNHVTQLSCMGLYPKYMDLKTRGGHCFGAVGDRGVLGGMAGVEPTAEGMRADLFFHESFAGAAPELLDACRKAAGGEVYLQIADCDAAKKRLAEELGFCPAEPKSFAIRGLQMPGTIYRV